MDDSGALEESERMYNGHPLQLELGNMVDSATGVDGPYEELWQPLLSSSETTNVIISGDLERMRGICIRVEDWIQGIYKNPNGEVSVIRAHLQANGEWKDYFIFGSSSTCLDMKRRVLFDGSDNLSSIDNEEWVGLPWEKTF
jgi:hypothetical protein